MQYTLAAPFDEPRPKGMSLAALVMLALGIAGAKTISAEFGPAGMTGIYAGGSVLAVELYAIWRFWKGANWARVLVLAVSLLNASAALASIVERNGSFVRLMSDPVRSVQLVFACFLLYWLNTPALRAWFQNAPTAVDLLGRQLEGKICTAVTRSAEGSAWVLAFEHDAELTLACPWRLVLEDNLAFASNARDGDAFGEAEPGRLLTNLRVKSVNVAPQGFELFIIFEMGIELQTWAGGLEGETWQYRDAILTVSADPEATLQDEDDKSGVTGEPPVNP